MMREVDLIETLASIQVTIMFACFYSWVRELCFFENLFAYGEFGACGDDYVFQTESDDVENEPAAKSLRSGEQKEASSHTVSLNINYDRALKEETLLRNFEGDNIHIKKDICLQYELCEIERL